MMERLNNISINAKKKLLNIYIAIFVIINLSIIYIIYRNFNTQIQLPQTYQLNLKHHIKQYKKNVQQYQSYTFFQNYDTLIYNNSVFNRNYQQSINKFSNLNQQQFYKLYQIVKKISIQKKFGQIARYGYQYNDWTKKNTVIRNQNGFNSSFIMASLTAIQYQLNKNNTQQWILLSAQQIIDCCSQCMRTKKPQTVFQYIRKNGVSLQKYYPYQLSRFDTQPKQCRVPNNTQKYKISSYESIKNCQSLQKQISMAPVVVGIDARKLYTYQYGIFQNCQRKTTHYSTLIGINYDHWKLQNSWGPKWGQRGFLRIGPGDTCGICLKGMIPIL